MTLLDGGGTATTLHPPPLFGKGQSFFRRGGGRRKKERKERKRHGRGEERRLGKTGDPAISCILIIVMGTFCKGRARSCYQPHGKWRNNDIIFYLFSTSLPSMSEKTKLSKTDWEERPEGDRGGHSVKHKQSSTMRRGGPSVHQGPTGGQQGLGPGPG